MASLYTPEPQRQGLDWLAGLVRSGQELAQNERRIQLAAQQQKIAQQEFWTRQQALKRQEDFQNRKFLYEMGQDQRTATRLELNAERSWLDTQADNALNTRREGRLDNEFAARNDPTTIDNQYRIAQTEAARVGMESTQAGTALKKQELEDIQNPEAPFSWNTPTKPGAPADPNAPFLLPDLQAGQSTKTGDPLYPIVGKDPAGNPYIIGASHYDKRGRPAGYVPKSLVPKGAAGALDPLDKEIDTFQDNLASLSAKLEVPPTYPVGPNVNTEATDVYKERKAAVEEINKPIREQIAQVQMRLADANAKKRIATTTLELGSITEEFDKKVAGDLQKALKSKDPNALRELRPKVETLAREGDESALATLRYLDGIFGKAAPVKSTGYYK